MENIPHKVEGIGTVKFKINDGHTFQITKLKDTLLVPTIQRNLISMYKMDKARLHAKLNKGFHIFSAK